MHFSVDELTDIPSIEKCEYDGYRKDVIIVVKHGHVVILSVEPWA